MKQRRIGENVAASIERDDLPRDAHPSTSVAEEGKRSVSRTGDYTTEPSAALAAASAVPYWRLSGFYFFYFASLGALLPYWSLYLKSLGFGSVQIGELMAIVMATKIISPNVWGWIADHTGRSMSIVRWASLFAALAFVGVFFGDHFGWLAAVMACFSFFWNASLPQFEAITLTYLGEDSHRYSHIRLWGSVGFILTVVVLGPVLDRYGVGLLPSMLLALFASIWLMSLFVAERGEVLHDPEQHSLHRVLRRPEVLAFLFVCFLMQAGHGPYYAFYSIYLKSQGYSGSMIGQLWALGVLAEVGAFLVMHQILKRFSLGQVLLGSIALAALRWVLIGALVDSFWVLFVAQILHAATFGTYHAAAIHLVHRYFTGRNQGRGQALYSSLSFGAGGALGSLASGYLWDEAGPGVTYGCAAVLSLVAFGVAWIWIREKTWPPQPR